MIIPSVHITSDQQIFWQHGFIKLNGTIVTTWAMMIAMTLGSFLTTRKLATERTISRWQSALEMIVTGIEGQIKEVGLDEPRKYLAFLGTLFLFIGTCSVHCCSAVRHSGAGHFRLSQDIHQANRDHAAIQYHQ